MAITEDTVRDRAQAMCDALVAGDVGRATEDFSDQLRQNLGEVIALLPLPASEATIASVDHGASGYLVILRLVGESDEVQLQVRWKDRDGRPTIVEASNVSQTALTAPIEASPDDESGSASGDR